MNTIKNTSLIIGLLLLPVSYFAAYPTLVAIIPPVLYVAAGILMIVLTVGGLGGAWVFTEMFRTRVGELKSRRQIAEAQAIKEAAEADKAQVLTILGKNGELIVRDTSPNKASIEYLQLHLDPNSRVNGKDKMPSDLQLRIYNQYYSRGKGGNDLIIESPPEPLALPSPERSSDWIERMVLPAHHVHYCGATGSGKTTLANYHIEQESKRDPGTKFYLIDPKAIGEDHSKPFIIDPDYKGIGEAIEGLQFFNEVLLKQKRNGPKTVFVIDEWDWIYLTYKNQAVELLGTLIKVGREKGIKVILVGQSPLSGDTGLSQSFYYNVARVAIWQEGARVLKVAPMDKEIKGQLMTRYEQLKSMAPQFKAETGQELRYCTVVPMMGNPSVEVIPFLPDPQPIDNNSAGENKNKRPISGSYDHRVCIAWLKVAKGRSPSCNKLHKSLTQNDVNVNDRQRQKYREILGKYGIEPKYF